MMRRGEGGSRSAASTRVQRMALSGLQRMGGSAAQRGACPLGCREATAGTRQGGRLRRLAGHRRRAMGEGAARAQRCRGQRVASSASKGARSKGVRENGPCHLQHLTTATTPRLHCCKGSIHASRLD